MHTSENDAVAQYVDKQTEMGAGCVGRLLLDD